MQKYHRREQDHYKEKHLDPDLEGEPTYDQAYVGMLRRVWRELSPQPPANPCVALATRRPAS